MKKNITIITNLYPLPWEKNRATFNKQQFELLDEDFNRHMLIPIAFVDWFKNKKQIKQTDNIRYVPYFYLPKFGRRFYSVFLFLSILLHSGLWLKRKKSDVFFASWAFPEAVATAWLSRIYNTKFFFKVHGSDINLHGDIPARAKQIVKASKEADGVVSVSQALKDKMVSMGVEASKIKVIYNGVNHEKFESSTTKSSNSPYILFVGNLKKEKGIFELLNGFSNIAKQYTTLDLIYAGPGKNFDALNKQAQDLGIEDRVKTLGAVEHSELPELMANATLVALPSYNEGVPNVLLEAMACGTPVLATNVGGIPEVIKDYCGYIINSKCSKEVSAGLCKVLEKDWNSSDIKEYSRNFSWHKNKNQLLSLITSNY